MSSLFASLSVAREALRAQQMGLNVTQNNIANVNTPGYTRQRANFVPGAPVALPEYQAGMGVRLDSIDSYRDRLLDYRLNQELQRQAEYDYSAAALQQVESILNEHAGVGLQSALTAFFNSFASLANAPEDASLRQQVLARAEQLAAGFRSVYEQIQSVRTMQERTIVDTVQEINSLAAGIARLNGEVVAAQGGKGNESTLRDQRQQLVDRLAQLTDVAYFETESGALTVMTRQGALLAVGTQSSSWSTTSGSDGLTRIVAEGADITSKIESGKLGGLLKVRDDYTAGYLADLDDLAAAIIARVNEQHAAGADIDGLQGGNFFVPFTPSVPGSNLGAARSMSVAISDTDRIAAAEIGAGPGSNVNANSLSAIQNELLMSGNSATVPQYYANLIFRIGLDAGTLSDNLQTQESLLAQLQNQRDAVSGVSLDEEAVDLLRYQKAYEANARFISLVDSLTEDLMQLLGA
jgi:flagellar hook-associated protein 1 FlgK